MTNEPLTNEKASRIIRGRSQREVAESLGMTVPEVARIEKLALWKMFKGLTEQGISRETVREILNPDN